MENIENNIVRYTPEDSEGMENNDSNIARCTPEVSEGKKDVDSVVVAVNGFKSNGTVEKTTQKPANLRSKKLKNLPLLIDCPKREIEALLRQKIRQCFIVFRDPVETSTELRFKEMKASVLSELNAFLEESNEIPSSVYQDVFKMFSINVFRDLPPPKSTAGANFVPGDDEDSQLNQSDPSWPHLELVYEFFVRFITSNNFDVLVAKNFVNQNFVSRMLDLFDSEEYNERGSLKVLLHRIYSKFLNLRSFIRKKISYIFCTFIYETERHSGIEELLDFLGSIIQGFACPLKAEHTTFFLKVILPLYSAKSLPSFYDSLRYCVNKYIYKDPSLAEPVVRFILRYWPKSNSNKEVLFLAEVTDILTYVDDEELKTFVAPLYKQISESALKPHFQVRERATIALSYENLRRLYREHKINEIDRKSNSSEYWKK